jgi:bifunctional non-homologous end joining protein LigD
LARLDEYRRKRDFRRTPEPAGESRARAKGAGGSFVVHKHAAQRLHYDLRLEQDGVLRSWAVPKGPNIEPGEKRLAVEVEDHPLEYGEFEGVIPKGEYGGGTVMLWDRGRWRALHEPEEDRIEFALEGRKLSGSWTLVRMTGERSDGGKNWLLIRHKLDKATGKRAVRHYPARNGKARAEVDAEERSVLSGRTMKQIASDRDAVWTSEGLQGEVPGAERPEPRSVPGARKRSLTDKPEPQLATLVDEAPGGDDWLHEIKFDGYRILARIERKREGGDAEVTLISRNGKDWTERFPEIAALLGGLPSDEALLDGEVVALESDGSSSFRRLQEALSAERTDRLVYQAFDLLHLDGHDLSRSPQVERKRALERLLAGAGFGASGTVRYTDHLTGKGPAFYERVCGLGLEGIISKLGDAPYRDGRGKSWLKVKCTRHEELLVGGYTEPAGSRSGFGALLLGAYDEEGRLSYTGKVGTGFGERQLRDLHARLRELEIGDPPFDPAPPGRGVHWVEPQLVAEVEFSEWTRDGVLRHPSFRGLREDKDPSEIVLPAEARAGTAAEGVGTKPARGEAAKGGAAHAMAKGGVAKGSAAKGGAAKGGAAKGGAQGAGGKTGRKRQVRPGAGRPGKDEAVVAGVRLSSPDRVLFPEQGVTKLALAEYYEDIEEWVLPFLRERPLSLVRCPQGRADECFFQKHPTEEMAPEVARIEIEESDGPAPYLYIRSLPDVIAMVQQGVLELHVWGSQVDDVEHPDILVFDLDPSPEVPWSEMLRVARELRERLQGLGLESFVRTTGGKGLHLVVPLVPKLAWDEAKEFAQAVAQAHQQDDRSRITTNMSKAKRRGKIFLDYLRNGRGATAIASYSTRARPRAPVATPVRWDELGGALRPDRYAVDNLRRRLAALRSDPWEGFDDARRAITRKMQAAVGRGSGR